MTGSQLTQKNAALVEGVARSKVISGAECDRFEKARGMAEGQKSGIGGQPS